MIDKNQVKQYFNKAAESYDEHAALSHVAMEYLLKILDAVRMEPEVVLDLGCGTGYSTKILAERYPQAKIVGLDFSKEMLLQAKQNCSQANVDFQLMDVDQLVWALRSVDLVFSNMLLPWCNDLNNLFLRVAHILKPDGVFIFSSLGPDSFLELKKSWQLVDSNVKFHPFVDMHDIGDQLLQVNLLDPVMESEYVAFNYSSVEKLLFELKKSGMQNVMTEKNKGLLTPRKLQRFIDEYKQLFFKEGRIPATTEIVYGHAWGATHLGLSQQAADGTHVVSIDALKKK